MNIGMQTWGSNGDIRPMLALANGLQKAGHQVTLVASSIDNKSYADICRQLRVAYEPVPEYVEFDMQGFAQRTLRMNSLQWLRALLDEAFFPYEQVIYAASKRLADSCDCVIGHHFLYPLKLAAAQRNKPYFTVTYCHAAIPSAQAPFRFPDLGQHVNRLSWRLLDAIFNWALKEPLTRLWLAEGGAPVRNVLTELLTSQQLNLVAVDSIFCPPQQQWPPNNYPCGFLNLTEDAQHWPIPPDVQDFLGTGEPPVYMTFGSLQQAVPEWSMDLFVEAAHLAGCRAIIQTSSKRYPIGSRKNHLYFIGKHPHQPLFGQCAAVVHHGGAGTTHAATFGGCPSVAVPFMDEQLFWAKQLQCLGLAGKPLPAKNVSAVTLANALRMTLDSPAMRHNAQAASRAMQSRDGVAEALRLIEMHSGKARFPS